MASKAKTPAPKPKSATGERWDASLVSSVLSDVSRIPSLLIAFSMHVQDQYRAYTILLDGEHPNAVDFARLVSDCIAEGSRKKFKVLSKTAILTWVRKVAVVVFAHHSTLAGQGYRQIQGQSKRYASDSD
jgi:hypothetical protein